MVKSANLTYAPCHVPLNERWRRNGHASGVLWFTGLSGSGKTTLALELERRLFDMGWHVCVLDGDNVRHGLSSDLGFSKMDREENIRRIGEVAKLLAESGALVITAFISPYVADRERARAACGNLFHEVFIDANLKTCEARDPKGLYAKARQGLIADFTGISAPYEAPSKPQLRVPTENQDIDACLSTLTDYAVSTFKLDKTRP